MAMVSRLWVLHLLLLLRTGILAVAKLAGRMLALELRLGEQDLLRLEIVHLLRIVALALRDEPVVSCLLRAGYLT